MKLWKQSGKVDCSFSDKFQFVDVPQCSNNKDDGILIMKFLEEWEPTVDPKFKFEASDVPNLRIKYANEMIFNQSNVANDGLSILKSFDNEWELQHLCCRPGSSLCSNKYSSATLSRHGSTRYHPFGTCSRCMHSYFEERATK